jgi:hypothetical protein
MATTIRFANEETECGRTYDKKDELFYIQNQDKYVVDPK